MLLVLAWQSKSCTWKFAMIHFKTLAKKFGNWKEESPHWHVSHAKNKAKLDWLRILKFFVAPNMNRRRLYHQVGYIKFSSIASQLTDDSSKGCFGGIWLELAIFVWLLAIGPLLIVSVCWDFMIIFIFMLMQLTKTWNWIFMELLVCLVLLCFCLLDHLYTIFKYVKSFNI